MDPSQDDSIPMLPQTLPRPDAATRKAFPLRLGGIDVGSNAIRLLVAEFRGPGQYRVLEAQRMPIRLGHDVFLSGRLTESAMDAACRALKAFREVMEVQGATLHRAVATSAVRESRNGDAFVARVRAEAGLELDVIHGGEEARLVHTAIRSRIPMGRNRWVSADLGGGSVEVSLVDADGILWSESHAMGSVRLLEELQDAGHEPGRFRRLLAEYLGALRLPLITERFRPAGFIATGGNIETLAKLAGVATDAAGVATLGLGVLRTLIDTLTRLPYHQRVDQLGLREDRADVILPAAMVYEKLATLAGVEELLVPFVGVRDGLVLDLFEQRVSPEERDRRRENQVVSACLTLLRRYLGDEAHANQVMELSLSLFDQLKGIHEMGESERRILTAAALLHDIGGFISDKRHHKHSQYLIQNAEIPGLERQEQLVASLVARYHRKSEPSLRHPEFAVLPPLEQTRVTRLAGLLRVADALDREHLQRVRTIRTRQKGRTLTLELDAGGDLTLERWAVAQKAQLLLRTFNLALALKEAR